MIHLQIAEQIATITLDDPERHNALAQDAIADFIAAIEAVSAAQARVLILTGTGKTFCAGARLDHLGPGGMTENPFEPLCAEINALPIPTIAALQGSVFGAGVELALACDFRIGVSGMKAAIPAAELGIHYTDSGIRRVVQRLGPQIARRMFLTAERFDDQALLHCGYLDQLVSAEAFEESIKKMSLRLAALAPLAVQGMKHSIRAAEEGHTDPKAALRINSCFASQDHAEALAARREGRPPEFSGH